MASTMLPQAKRRLSAALRKFCFYVDESIARIYATSVLDHDASACIIAILGEARKFVNMINVPSDGINLTY